MKKDKSKDNSRVGSGPIPEKAPKFEDYLSGTVAGKNPVKSVGKSTSKVAHTPSASKPSKPIGKDVKKPPVTPVKKGGAKLTSTRTQKPKKPTISKKVNWSKKVVVLVFIALVAVAIISGSKWLGSSGDNGGEKGAVVEVTLPTMEEETEVGSSSQLALVIERDDIYQVIDTVSTPSTFQPVWPEGTDQTSVGYSNPEEFPDGRTFMTRSQSNPEEVMAFVARCISINNGPQYCHSDESGALVGLIVGHPDGEYPVKLWDAELKTLAIPGDYESWKAYVYELANFISANKGGKPVEILGPAK